MAEASWPSPTHNSRSVTDTELEQLHHPWSGDGLVGTTTDADIVYGDASGMNVKIRADRFALVRGRLYSSGSSDLTKTITANASGLTRVDLVVLRLTRATAAITSEVKAGTPGAGAPSLTQNTGTTGVYEIPLASVSVPSGDTSIAANQVTPLAYYLGDQIIVCKAATRPDHAPGRVIWETDTGSLYVSTGSAWRSVWEDTGDVTVSPASNWIAGTGTGLTVRRRNGIVFLTVDLVRQNSFLGAAVSALGTLAAGYRPAVRKSIVAWSTGEQLVRIEVATSGVVSIVNSNGLAVGEFVNGSGSWVAA